jgi:hypothetical protein
MCSAQQTPVKPIFKGDYLAGYCDIAEFNLFYHKKIDTIPIKFLNKLYFELGDDIAIFDEKDYWIVPVFDERKITKYTHLIKKDGYVFKIPAKGPAIADIDAIDFNYTLRKYFNVVDVSFCGLNIDLTKPRSPYCFTLFDYKDGYAYVYGIVIASLC